MGERYNERWMAEERDRCIAVWRECAPNPASLDPASLAPKYSLRDHEARELAYDAAQREVEWEAKRTARGSAARSAAEKRMVASFARFAANALDLEEEQIALLTDDFLPAGIDFARRARAFDPNLSQSDILQACRNSWTACGLQPLLGAPAEITPSILAYSLLYPYTDNYLDGAGTALSAKRSFSRRFRERLRGENAPVLDERERAVWTLVDRIETQFPRTQYPAVYDCLLAIHQAQEDSLAQLKSGPSLNDAELLRLSFAKGGASVLVDACLARGAMNREESRAAFQWGALLQLGDDLQDLRDDLDRGSATLFTRAVEQGQPLDALVLQLLAFCARVSAQMNQLPHGSRQLKDLLGMSWRSLILGAIAEADKFFTPGFLRQVELASPFRFEFLRARRRRLAGREGLYARLFDRFVDAETPALPTLSVSRASSQQQPLELMN